MELFVVECEDSGCKAREKDPHRTIRLFVKRLETISTFERITNTELLASLPISPSLPIVKKFWAEMLVDVASSSKSRRSNNSY